MDANLKERMKKMKHIFQFTSLILISLFSIAFTNESQIDHLDLSLWSEYKANNLSELSQKQATSKLKKIFEDKLIFVQKHKVRQLIIKILNPNDFDFFHPESFNAMQPDNFGYFAKELAQFSEVYALFDKEQFYWRDDSRNLQSKASDYWSAMLGKQPYGAFEDLDEKLSWFSIINNWYYGYNDSYRLISGIVIDPKGSGNNEVYQNLINRIDQYRTEGLKDTFWHSTLSDVKIGFLLGIDQKDLALANLARFPLKTDIKSGKLYSIGLDLPESFPSESPHFAPPTWRKDEHHPLVDMIYLQMFDARTSHSIYSHLQDPLHSNPSQCEILASYFGNLFRGEPFVQGPGKITQIRGETEVKGTKTYFKLGGIEENKGRFIQGGKIEVRPPFLPSTVRRTIEETPQDNKTLFLDSTFSLSDDVIKADYFYCPILTPWTAPSISHFIANKIYFVFSTDLDHESPSLMGNWGFENFLHFLSHPEGGSGFLSEAIFTGPNNTPINAPNNIVIYDYSTIPNGTLIPESNWDLGNQTH